MATTKDETYFILRKKTGEAYLCPLHSVKNRDKITEDELDSCVEKDVVERYSGNIDIEP